MHLFHIDAVKDGREGRGTRTWLVIAETLFDALSLIPLDEKLTAAEVRVGAVLGPERVIGWLGAAPAAIALPAWQLEWNAINLTSEQPAGDDRGWF